GLSSRKQKKARRNYLLRRAFRSGAGGVRTRDLLNAIQAEEQRNSIPHQVDAPSTESRCTSGCTSEAEGEQTDPGASLAAALLGLSPEDRARLAAMLLGKADNG